MHTTHSNTQYKNESKHSEMGPVRQNPIQRTVSLFICVCASYCAQLLHTVLHRTDLIVFPLPSRQSPLLGWCLFEGRGDIGAFYNITKNQDNPIKTVGRDSFLIPKTPKNTSFYGSPSPHGSHSPYILGDTSRPRHITYVQVWSKDGWEKLCTNKQTDTTKIMVTWPWTKTAIITKLGYYQ